MLAHKPSSTISAGDLLAITYHLLIQDRVEDAIGTFRRLSGLTAFQGALARAGSSARLGSSEAGTASSSDSSTGEWANLQTEVSNHMPSDGDLE